MRTGGAFVEPKDGGVLVDAIKLLLSKGFRFREWHEDNHGHFAATMASPTGYPFVIGAKGSKAMLKVCKGKERRIVSFHKELMEMWNSVVVLAWRYPDNQPFSFFLFDPREAVYKSLFSDTRGDDTAETVNLDFDELATPWSPEEDLAAAWKTKKDKQGGLDKWS